MRNADAPKMKHWHQTVLIVLFVIAVPKHALKAILDV